MNFERVYFCQSLAEVNVFVFLLLSFATHRCRMILCTVKVFPTMSLLLHSSSGNFLAIVFSPS